MISNSARLTRRFLQIARRKRGILERFYCGHRPRSTSADTLTESSPERLPEAFRFPRRDW